MCALLADVARFSVISSFMVRRHDAGISLVHVWQPNCPNKSALCGINFGSKLSLCDRRTNECGWIISYMRVMLFAEFKDDGTGGWREGYVVEGRVDGFLYEEFDV